ncbi:MAG: hypothetical protein U9N52_01115 [Campylobacterota bacterium]|nr:hypothetical protein [Campylobacterota bacterium]
MKLKILLLLTLLSVVSLHASFNGKAYVNTPYLDLYYKPVQTAQKKSAYYKKGQLININGCNTEGWCKVKSGYVKAHLLKFSHYSKQKLTTLKPSKTKIAHEEIDLDLYEPKIKPIIKQKQASKTSLNKIKGALKNDNNITLSSQAYETYFRPKSDHLHFKKGK